LRRVNKQLNNQELGLILYDGYRPIQVVQMFWDKTPPHLIKIRCKPKRRRSHPRGYSVDLSLYDLKTGKPLEMTSGYDEFTKRAHADYPKGSSQARQNRDFLRNVMETTGFKVYPYEWWHFDYLGWEKQPAIDTSFENIEKRWMNRIRRATNRVYLFFFARMNPVPQ
jgi:zinc D-Ala-D-Ala dipeptidase